MVWSLRPRALETGHTESKSLSYLPNYVTLGKLVSRSNLSFIICKMGIMTAPRAQLL